MYVWMYFRYAYSMYNIAVMGRYFPQRHNHIMLHILYTTYQTIRNYDYI